MSILQFFTRRPLARRYKLTYSIQHDMEVYYFTACRGITTVPQLDYRDIYTVLSIYFEGEELDQALEEYRKNDWVLLPDGHRMLREIGYDIDYWAMVVDP